MNNTVINQQKDTTNLYRQLTLNSPLFEYLKPADYNLYDEDEGVIHIHKLGFDQNRVFYDIRNYTHIATNTVTYSLEPSGAICFRILNKIKNKQNTILIHEPIHQEIIEYIFQIKLSPVVVTLPFVDSDSFYERMMNLSSNTDVFTPRFADIYLDTEANKSCEVHARTLCEYQAGVAHIKYLIDSLPESVWLEADDRQNNVLYKHLFVEEDEDTLVFSLYTRKNGIHSSIHHFCLEFSDVRDDIQVYCHHENKELLQKLKPMYRKYSMNDILRAM
ncbi:hypothetical protein [Pontibacter mangrovi]|uniref:Uncharacterized protein n=1 Tax=Pontibacter mangrovi TaxID=2589816 RepID=A0A501W5P5_9BACT|nr:hypothetical protein [Pontibacter mangrovi]TPE43620.1 hypothetical protein FJM65_12755 [Pontibacter mangrovi]